MAMSKHSQSYVEEMLTCSVCLELVNEPRTLQQCFHSFCKLCVKQLVKKQANPEKGVICPVCRSYSSSEEIRINFFVNDLLQMHKDSLDKNQVRMCQQCSDKVDAIVAEWKCLDCRLDICETCKSSHLKIPILKAHCIMPLNEETKMVVDKLVFCESHTDKTVELFCLDCEMLICIKCKVTDHESHKCETVEKALERILAEVKICEKDLDEDILAIDNAVTDAETKIQEIKSCHADCSSKLDKDAKEKIAQIKSIKTRMQDQIKRNEVKQIDLIKKAKEKFQNQKEEKQNLKMVVSVSVQRGRHASLLSELINEKLFEKLKAKKGDYGDVLMTIRNPRFQSSTKLEDKNVGNLRFRQTPIHLGSNVINSRILTRNSLYEELSRSFVRKSEHAFDDEFVLRLALVGERELWASMPSSHEIKIFTINDDFKFHQTIPVQSVRGIVYLNNGDVIAACCGEGIYAIGSKNKEITEISSGYYSDVFTMCGSTFCTLEYEINKLHIYNKSAGAKTYSKNSQVTLLSENLIPSYKNTLFVSSCAKGQDTELVDAYIHSFKNNILCNFNRKGELIGKFDLKYYGKLSGYEIFDLYLCAIDLDGCLLIANWTDGGFYIFDETKDENKKFTSVASIKYMYRAYDLVTNNRQTIWVAAHHNGEYKIIKYCCHE